MPQSRRALRRQTFISFSLTVQSGYSRSPGISPLCGHSRTQTDLGSGVCNTCFLRWLWYLWFQPRGRPGARAWEGGTPRGVLNATSRTLHWRELSPVAAPDCKMGLENTEPGLAATSVLPVTFYHGRKKQYTLVGSPYLPSHSHEGSDNIRQKTCQILVLLPPPRLSPTPTLPTPTIYKLHQLDFFH